LDLRGGGFTEAVAALQLHLEASGLMFDRQLLGLVAAHRRLELGTRLAEVREETAALHPHEEFTPTDLLPGHDGDCRHLSLDSRADSMHPSLHRRVADDGVIEAVPDP